MRNLLRGPGRSLSWTSPGFYRGLRLANKVGLYVVASGLAVAFLFPMVWMVSASFRPEQFVYARFGSLSSFLPWPFTLQNYPELYRRAQLALLFGNSVIVCSSVMAVGVAVNCLAGYALARLRFPLREQILTLLIAIVIVPGESLLIPQYLICNRLGWLDSYHVQVVPFAASAFYIIFFRQIFRGIPSELEDASKVDGASPFTTFRCVFLPLAKPALFVVALLEFSGHWSDFIWPLITTTTERFRPLQVGLNYVFWQVPVRHSVIMAMCTLVTLPIVLLYVCFQRYFVRGVELMSGSKY